MTRASGDTNTSHSGERIDCANVTVERSKRRVLEDVSVRVGLNECIGIIGPNGAGKSSLALALLGLLRPLHGTITLRGEDVSRIAPRRRAACFAYVPQIHGPLPALMVREVVATGRYPSLGALQPFTPEAHAAVEAALDACGLRPIAQRPISQVSAGERQKALIAAAMAQDAQMMFLDEPDASLDPGYEVGLARLLRAWRERGRGIVLISHDLGFTSAVCDRVIALRGGRVAADAPLQEMLSPDRLADLYQSTFEIARTQSGRSIIVSAW